MKKIIIGLVMLSFKVGISQPISTYSKFLGDTILVDWATGMVVKDDTFYIVGENYDQAQLFQNLIVYKTDVNANKIMHRIYNRASHFVTSGGPSSIKITLDNYIIIGGADLSSVNSVGLLYKFKLNLDSVFIKEYKIFDTLNAFLNINELSNGNYILCGSSSITKFFEGYDAWYIVTDTLGNIVWQRTFGNSNDADFAGFTATYSGGFISSWYEWDKFLPNIINMNNDSTIKWIKQYTKPNKLNSGGPITATIDGGFLIVNKIDTSNVSGSKLDPVVIHKLDSNGNVIWETYLPQITDYKEINKVIETSTGSIVLVGNIPVFQGTTNIPMLGWLVKLGADGRIIWNQNYYTTLVNDQYLLDVKETPDGGYVACGTAINPATNNQDAWILKVDSNGCLDGFGCPKINYPTAIIPTEIEQSHFIIYPNPAISSFTIALTETPFIKEYKELQFTLFDITGRKVIETTLTEQTTTIQREDISTGVYLYQIREGERSIKNGKLILK